MKDMGISQVTLCLFSVMVCVVVLLLAFNAPCQAQNSHDLDLNSNLGGVGVTQARAQEEEGQPSNLTGAGSLSQPSGVPQQSSISLPVSENSGSAPQTTEVNKLEVTSTNEVLGGIEAKDGGEVSVGDTELAKVKAESITINSKNKITGDIDAGGATVKTGTVNLKNYQGQKVNISTDNTANGKITTKQKGTVSLGNVNVGGVEEQSGGVGNPGAGIGSSKPIIPRNPLPNDPPNDDPPSNDNDQCTIKKKTGEISDICSESCKNGDVCSEDCAIESGCNVIDGCSIPKGLNWWFTYKDVFGGAEACCSPSPSDRKPCNNHDVCYQKCVRDTASWEQAKAACDNALRSESENLCKQLPKLFRLECYSEAYQIYAGVRTVYSDVAFAERQLLFCHGIKTE